MAPKLQALLARPRQAYNRLLFFWDSFMLPSRLGFRTGLAWGVSIAALGGAILVVLGTAIAAGLPLVRPPSWYMSDYQGPVSSAINSYRAALGPIFAALIQLLGALFLSTGLLFSWRQLKLGREQHLDESMARALDHLASDKIDIRIGAMFRLRALAQRHKELRWMVVDMLAQFVRGRCDTTGPGGHEDLRTAIETCSVLAAMDEQRSASRRRSLRPRPVDPEQHQRMANLSGVDFSNAALRGVTFRNANLGGSKFNGADLREARFLGCSLNGATFIQSTLDFANVSNCSARVNLCHASAIGASFNNCVMDAAWLDDANFAHAQFERSVFGFVSARRASFVRANLAKTFLTGSEIFDGADFTDARLPSERDGLRSIRPSQFSNGPDTRPMWFPW